MKLDRVDIGADPIGAHFEGWVYVWPSQAPACTRETGQAGVFPISSGVRAMYRGFSVRNPSRFHSSGRRERDKIPVSASNAHHNDGLWQPPQTPQMRGAPWRFCRSPFEYFTDTGCPPTTLRLQAATSLVFRTGVWPRRETRCDFLGVGWLKDHLEVYDDLNVDVRHLYESSVSLIITN